MITEMKRLDVLLVERGLFESRERARRGVMAGIVEVAGQRVDKPGTAVREDVELSVREPAEPYVSRAGRKLAAALERFELEPTGLVCLDVGASTGGFTDCLLRSGASRVYAVDVGYGQLDHRLRQDPRVVVMERVNARHLEPNAIPEACDLITVDVSFISLAKVVPALLPHLAVGGRIVTLIKPQFEAGRDLVGKGGIVRDETVRCEVVEKTAQALGALGLERLGLFDSPVTGARGNREALALFACSWESGEDGMLSGDVAGSDVGGFEDE